MNWMFWKKNEGGSGRFKVGDLVMPAFGDFSPPSAEKYRFEPFEITKRSEEALYDWICVSPDGFRLTAQEPCLKKFPPHDDASSWDDCVWKPKTYQRPQTDQKVTVEP